MSIWNVSDPVYKWFYLFVKMKLKERKIEKSRALTGGVGDAARMFENEQICAVNPVIPQPCPLNSLIH